MPAEKPPAPPRYAVVVLSMHRSGSSALAGLFGQMGCDLPATLMPASEHNPKGYFESNRIYKINDDILASGASSWDDWTEFDPGWAASPEADSFLSRGLDVLREEFGTSSLLAIKDPRICRLLPFWRKLLTAAELTPVYVHNHRHPLEVARSLHIREGWPLEYGLLLWLRHVLDAEARSRGCTRVFTNFERTLEDWPCVIHAVQKHSDIVFPRQPEETGAQIDGFLSKDLRHNVEPKAGSPDSARLSDWVSQAYDILERWVASGEDTADHEALDALRARFTATTPMFGALLRELRASLKTAAQEAEAAAEHTARLNTDIERLGQDHAAVTAARNTLASERDSLLGERDSLIAERDHLVTARNSLQAERDSLAAERRKLQEAMRQARQTHEAKQADLHAHIAALESEKDLILGSTSWKLTAPMRRVVNMLRS
ncbi:sulfotransferase family protein (plasmid) [Roseovarius faecimaris]|uniref:Sulfotransferase family protein n=1 Tax=Roseovarius faecimaris TaxID=2494550 RepID=A0A6I6IIN3_9RHOB|nr:sulfotransferase family protein [Roseovarius faecimaris]QGX96780.1 sulfotransferase family protein [Roseovarius faecimaris]